MNKTKINLLENTFKVSKNGKSYKFSINGINSKNLSKLVMLAASGIILKARGDTAAVWSHICSPEFIVEKQKKYPVVVSVLALLKDIGQEEADNILIEMEPEKIKEMKLTAQYKHHYHILKANEFKPDKSESKDEPDT